MSARHAVLLTVCAIAALAPCARAGDLSQDELARLQDLDARTFQELSNRDLAEYLVLRDRLFSGDPSRPSVSQNVTFFAQKGLGQAFRLNAVRFDNAESDCVVFVERCLSAALAKDWLSYRLVADRLRHRNGAVAFRERNFSTLGDWLPNNRWLLRDITGQFADEDGPLAEEYTFEVREKVFVDVPGEGNQIRTIFKGSDYKSGQVDVRTDVFIPKDRIEYVLKDLKSGDVVLILRKSSRGHLACTHLGIVVSDGNGRFMVSSGPPRVSKRPLSGMSGFDWVAGYKFLRLREDCMTAATSETLNVSTRPADPETEDQKVLTLRLRRVTSNSGGS